MGKVFTALSMSLDGFIAGPGDACQDVFAWYGAGDTEYRMPSGRMALRVTRADADVLGRMHAATGALVTGRQTFDVARGWGGRHPMDRPVFVVTHRAPAEWAGRPSPFTFVTDGPERAIALARAAAGGKDVGVGAASLSQQALRAGLLDEVLVHLVPVLLGGGTRWFDHLGTDPTRLERTEVVASPTVTHLRFRVLR